MSQTAKILIGVLVGAGGLLLLVLGLWCCMRRRSKRKEGSGLDAAVTKQDVETGAAVAGSGAAASQGDGGDRKGKVEGGVTTSNRCVHCVCLALVCVVCAWCVLSVCLDLVCALCTWLWCVLCVIGFGVGLQWWWWWGGGKVGVGVVVVVVVLGSRSSYVCGPPVAAALPAGFRPSSVEA